MAISNQHFSYDFKTPVYQQNPEIYEFGKAMGKKRDFENLQDSLAADIRMEEIEAELEGRQAPIPQTQDDILAELRSQFQFLPPDALEQAAGQKFAMQQQLGKIKNKYDVASRSAELAMEQGNPSLYDYFSNQSMDFSKNINAMEGNLNGILAGLKKSNDDYGNEKRVLYQNMMSFMGSEGWGKLSEEQRENITGFLKNTEDELSKTELGRNIFKKRDDEADAKIAVNEGAQKSEPMDYRAFINENYAKEGMTKSDLNYLFDEIAERQGLTANHPQYKRAKNLINEKYEEKEAAKEAALALENLNYSRNLAAKDRQISREKEKLENDTKFEPIMKDVLSLEAGDKSIVRPAFNEYLAKKAGATVTPIEMVRYISAVLKDEAKAAYESDAKKAIAAGAIPMFGESVSAIMDSDIMSKYLDSIDSNMLAKTFERSVPTTYSSAYRAKYGKKETSADTPKAGNPPKKKKTLAEL